MSAFSFYNFQYYSYSSKLGYVDISMCHQNEYYSIYNTTSYNTLIFILFLGIHKFIIVLCSMEWNAYATFFLSRHFFSLKSNSVFFSLSLIHLHWILFSWLVECIEFSSL